MANLQSLIINDTGFIKIPHGTTSQRPANPQTGYIRFNTSIGKIEVYNGSGWQNAPPDVSATGAFSTTSLYGYDIIAFTGNGTLTVNSGGEVEYLIVGGGGGGGKTDGAGAAGAGGGAGGVLYGKTYVSAGSYSVTVGNGGTAAFENSTNGGNSSVFGITALGGGAGGSRDIAGSNGGSGGGTQLGNFGDSNFGLGTSGQGNRGGSGANASSPSSGGGGGGAGGPGEDGKTLSFQTDLGGRGGPGLYYGDVFSENFGENGWFGGGGGGGNGSSTYRSFGGIGGGGDGGDANGTNSSGTVGQPGLANTGGGGGGGPVEPIDAGVGGSGIVLIKIQTPSQPISASGGNVTDVRINGRLFREHVFSGNSNYNFTVTSLGTTNGEVEYELQLDGYQPDSGWESGIAGYTVRKLSSFSATPCFKYLSTQTASSLGYTSNGGQVVGSDPTNRAQASVGGACRVGVTWDQGFDLHMNNGGRMPTLEEYLNNVTQGSGCGHDNTTNWTVTNEGDPSQRFVVMGDNDFNRNGGTRLEPLDFGATLRDVADVDLNRSDPVILQDRYVYNRLVSLGITPEIVDPPRVATGTYDLLLGSGLSGKIPNTGPAQSGTKNGVDNRGTVIIRYPLEPL